MRSSRRLRAAGVNALMIDTSRRPGAEAQVLGAGDGRALRGAALCERGIGDGGHSGGRARLGERRRQSSGGDAAGELGAGGADLAE